MNGAYSWYCEGTFGGGDSPLCTAEEDVCGDSLVQSGATHSGNAYALTVPTESCDDGNTIDGDGCSVSCLIESVSCDLVVVPTT